MDEINKKIDVYIEGLVLGILAHPSLQNLNPQQREEYAQKLRGHFYDLILETAFDQMNPEQIADLKANLDNPPVLASKIEEYSTQIPDLLDDIETRLQKEFDVMKITLSTVKPS